MLVRSLPSLWRTGSNEFDQSARCELFDLVDLQSRPPYDSDGAPVDVWTHESEDYRIEEIHKGPYDRQIYAHVLEQDHAPPPGLVTRPISCKPRTASGTEQKTNVAVAASKLSSRKPSR